MTLPTLSIKSLYSLALAEGEGVGTAYEYFAKRLALDSWLRNRPRPARLLVAGLPEKYGSSLDFLQLADDFAATVTVVDERPAALEKLDRGLSTARASGLLTAVQPRLLVLSGLDDFSELVEGVDLAVSSEVLQRLEPGERSRYVACLSEMSSARAFFAPNGDNPAHTAISGLSGLTLAELQTLIPSARTGYVDMPPFPPGITRSDEQRAQASSGAVEAMAMRGLEIYARLEWLLPNAVRRRQSHIVFALERRGPGT